MQKDNQLFFHSTGDGMKKIKRADYASDIGVGMSTHSEEFVCTHLRTR